MSMAPMSMNWSMRFKGFTKVIKMKVGMAVQI